VSTNLPEETVAALRSARHELHRNPELSGEEAGTAGRIAAWLSDYGPDRVVTGLGGTGVAAEFSGAADGPTVLIRCELDALPIAETGDHDHVSTVSGKAHQCGHDGHMAILLGIGSLLSTRRPARGRVVLLFQPAEETGKGARAVLADPGFASIAPDYAVALHNLPGYPLHQVLLKDGHATCASRGMRIRLTGKTAHASMPETGVSPALALASIIRGLAGLSRPERLDEDFLLVTIVHAALGEQAFGVSPADGQVWATLRTLTNQQMDALVGRATAIAEEQARQYGLRLEIDYDDVFSATRNDPQVIGAVRRSAEASGLDSRTLTEPMRFSEDFGEFGHACRSALFFLGAGENHPALHNPDYDFPDALIPSGASVLYETAIGLLER
jgi:amidohydrolase